MQFAIKEEKTKITPQNDHDLWFLYNFLQVGEKISSHEKRKIKIENKPTIVNVFLTIEIEKKKYNDYGTLRIGGKITHSSSDLVPTGNYHFIEIKKNESFILNRKLEDFEIKLFKEMEGEEKNIHLILLDYREMNIYKIRRRKFEKLASFSISGKRNYEGWDFSIVDDFLKCDLLFVGGPNKKNLMEYLKTKNIKAIETKIRDIYENDVQNFIKSGEIEKHVKKLELARQQRLFEKFMKLLATKPNMVAYGKNLDEIAQSGFIEDLLLLDTQVNSHRETIKNVKSNGGNVEFVDSTTNIGYGLSKFGGAVAILRFPWEE